MGEDQGTMDATDRGLRFAVRAYFATMGVAVLITVFALLFVVDTSSCGSVSRAFPLLVGAIAVLFLVSVAVVGVGAHKVIQDVSRRWGMVVLYAIILLASCFFLSCGLMVLLNC